MSFSSNKTAPNNIDLSSSQTLSNKTLDNTNDFSGDVIDPSRLDVKKDTKANLDTYASSATNGQLCFATDIKKMYQVVDSALEEVGSGVSGGINYIENPDAELDTSGWAEYSDAAGELPVDGTGGTVGTEVQLTRNASSPLRGTGDFDLAKDGVNRQGFGASYDFTIDSADQAKKLTISFDYTTSTNYADADIKVFIYDVTNSNLIRINGEDLKANSSNATHYAQFQTAPDSTSYRLILHVSSNNGSAYSINFDNVKVGPTNLTFGTTVTDWEEFTMNIEGSTTNPTKGTIFRDKAFWRRVGDSMEIRYEYRQNAAGSAGSGTYIFRLPSGYTADTSKIQPVVNTARPTLGAAIASEGGAVDDLTGVVSLYDSTGLMIVGVDGADNTQIVDSAFADLAGTNTEYSFFASVPIAGWSSNAQSSQDLGNRDVVVRALGNGTGDSAPQNTFTKIASWSEQEDTADIFANGTATIPETGYYDISFSATVTDATDADLRQFTLALYVNGSNVVEFSEGNSNSVGDALSLMATGAVNGYKLNKGDTVEIYGKQINTDGDTLNIAASSTLRNSFHLAKRASPQTMLETETVAARYYVNSGQLLTNNVVESLIYDTKEFDTHNAYSTSTGNYTVPVSGFYRININCILDNAATWNPGDELALRIRVNNIDLGGEANHQLSATDFFTINADATLELEKGDVVDFTIKQVSGTNVNVQVDREFNYLEIIRIK